MGQFFNKSEHEQSSISEGLNECMKTAELKKSAFLLIIFLLVGILVLIAAVTEIPITRKATGIISSENGAANIYNNKEVYRVYAYAGQSLKKGDKLLEYSDGSFELMTADGMLLEVNRTGNMAGNEGKVISYLAEGSKKKVYFFLPTEMAMGIKNGQEVHLAPSVRDVSPNGSGIYIGKVSYVNDNFFDMQEIQDFIGSADTTNLIIKGSTNQQSLYRLVGVDAPEYISLFASNKGAGYENYIDSICNVTVTVNKVSVLKYLFSF